MATRISVRTRLQAASCWRSVLLPGIDLAIPVLDVRRLAGERGRDVLAPIVNIVPLQWLAYHLSRKIGVDADSFRRDEPRYAAAQSMFTL